MTSVALQAVNLRLDVMSIALAELARAVSPSQAERVAEAIDKQAMDRLAGASMVGSQARLQSASAKHPRTDSDKLNGL